jgi:hypothetical protein
MAAKPRLTIRALQKMAVRFARKESAWDEPTLYGKTDGKKIGTYFEQKFLNYLSERSTFSPGSSSKDTDLPGLKVDIKVTSKSKPQSSSPYKSAKQKFFGLGHSLLVFVYRKVDNKTTQTGRLEIVDVVYIDARCTGDFSMPRRVSEVLNKGKKSNLVDLVLDAHLPGGEMSKAEATQIAQDLADSPPQTGYLTISNALQWRLMFSRAIKNAGKVPGILKLQ